MKDLVSSVHCTLVTYTNPYTVSIIQCHILPWHNLNDETLDWSFASRMLRSVGVIQFYSKVLLLLGMIGCGRGLPLSEIFSPCLIQNRTIVNYYDSRRKRFIAFVSFKIMDQMFPPLVKLKHSFFIMCSCAYLNICYHQTTLDNAVECYCF